MTVVTPWFKRTPVVHRDISVIDLSMTQQKTTIYFSNSDLDKSRVVLLENIIEKISIKNLWESLMDLSFSWWFPWKRYTDRYPIKINVHGPLFVLPHSNRKKNIMMNENHHDEWKGDGDEWGLGKMDDGPIFQAISDRSTRQYHIKTMTWIFL